MAKIYARKRNIPEDFHEDFAQDFCLRYYKYGYELSLKKSLASFMAETFGRLRHENGRAKSFAYFKGVSLDSGAIEGDEDSDTLYNFIPDENAHIEMEESASLESLAHLFKGKNAVVFRSRHIDHKSFEDIASYIGMCVASVKAIDHENKKKILKALSKEPVK